MRCLDASVLYEITLGNVRFLRYGEGNFVIPDTTLAELCSVILKAYDEKTSDYWFRKFQAYAWSISAELLYEAVKFRWKQKHKKLSFFDAVVYVFARHHKCALITADSDFQHLPGVEFVK